MRNRVSAAPAALTLALALLAGCSTVPVATPLAAAGSDRARSWMVPGAAKGSLLYVSDTATNDVYVFSYPQGRLAGTLTGFDDPQGLCSDQNGNVFIANSAGEETLEYAHGGKAPIQTLYDPPRSPEGCAVDPVTGNLAVSEGGSETLAIYAKATGKPKHYKSPDITQFAFCGYDDLGDLFIDGSNYYYYDFELDELSAGGKALKNVALAQTIEQAGGVQWDGKYLAVGDAGANAIYQFTVKGHEGTLEGTTTLTGATMVDQFWIAGSRVVAANVGGPNVMVWSYPGGGSPIEVVSNPGVQPHKPFGVTVSLLH
jgi:hypothetical protein